MASKGGSCPPNDARSLAEAFVALAGDPATRRPHGRGGAGPRPGRLHGTGRDGRGETPLARRCSTRMIADPVAFIRDADAPAPGSARAGDQPATWPTRRRSSGRRPRRSSARSACRRRSGPSPGPAARRSPATSSTTRARARDRRVLDFASGSGLVAIAAAKAGARRVTACDIDRLRRRGDRAQRRGERRRVDAVRRDLVGLDEGWDTVLAGDICYERDLAARVVDWLSGLAGRGRDGAHRRSGPQLSAEGAARSSSPPTRCR